MTIVAFLQNQYFHNPQKARDLYDRNPELRERLNRQFLFAGCVAGRRLERAFGYDSCQQIIWEEISPEIGGQSNSIFPADQIHINRVISKHQPNIILAFGNPAVTALRKWQSTVAMELPVKPMPILLCGPHPTARYPDICQQLADMADELIHVQYEIFGIDCDARYRYAV